MAVRNVTRGTDVASDLKTAFGVLERMRGLLGRSSLDPGEALWIAPCASIHTVGMRFPIDAAFLDREGRVLRCFRHLEPNRMTRLVRGARGVLELQAGSLERAATQVGDHLDLGL